MNALIICGSRNRKGQTAQAVQALADGIAQADGACDTVFLPELTLERCRQCNNDGWGTCRSEGKCAIADDFAKTVDRLSAAGAVAFVTPVYFGDLSESMKAFADRLRRTCRHESAKKKVEGKRCVGVCVAGGGGGGAPNCCVSLERVLGACGFDMVDLVPVRRQNLAAKVELLKRVGASLAS
jgi:multimeric flavodoxin WrbA